MKKLLVAAVMIVSLSGCATQVPVHSNNLNTGLLNIKTEISNSKLTITRDKGVTGSGHVAVVYLDGQKIGEFRPTDSAIYYIKPGTHLLELKGEGLFASKSPVDSTEFTISEDSPKQYRIAVVGANLQLLPTR